MSRQSSPVAPFGQYLPRPYAPSIDAATRVNSSASFASGGAAIVNDVLQEIELAALGRADGRLLKARRVLRKLRGGADEGFIGLRGHRVGVVGDVGGLDPARAVRGVAELQQVEIDLGEEGSHVGRRVAR